MPSTPKQRRLTLPLRSLTHYVTSCMVRCAAIMRLTFYHIQPTGLNTPSSHSRTIRPVEMIAALSQPEPGKRIPLFSSREHQDAQELFQLVSEYVKKEATAVDREGARDLGFGAISSLSSEESAAASYDVSKGVFDGLTANRRSCCECGYTEAVMHFPFDNWQLTVPRIVRTLPFSPHLLC